MRGGIELRLLNHSEFRRDGCWKWIGAVDPKGYGRIWFAGKAWPAHRASWSVFRGAIPSGRHVCHRCDNPGCINPDHLFLGTNRNNVLDRHRKGRSKNLFVLGNQAARKSQDPLDTAYAFEVAYGDGS